MCLQPPKSTLTDTLVPYTTLFLSLSGYPERPARLCHSLAVQKPSHKPQTFFFHRTLLPRHQHLRPNARKCYPCVRYKTSPMSRVAHFGFGLQATKWTDARRRLGVGGAFRRSVLPVAHLEGGEEGGLRDLHVADLAHALLAGLLLFQQLPDRKRTRLNSSH